MRGERPQAFSKSRTLSFKCIHTATLPIFTVDLLHVSIGVDLLIVIQTWIYTIENGVMQHYLLIPFCYIINVNENRKGNQEWTIQRHWQHRVHKTKTNKQKHNRFWLSSLGSLGLSAHKDLNHFAVDVFKPMSVV
jgi:hypothetical protein